MENMGILAEGVAGRQSIDDVACARNARISGGSQHDAESSVQVPLGFDLVELAIDRMFQELQEIGFQAHQDRLGFGIAHAAVEFQGFDAAVLADHQSGVKEAGVRHAFERHALDGGVDDFADDLGVDARRDRRCRRVRTHAAGVGAGVAVADALVILAGGERQHVFAVDHDDEADLFAIEKFFDHDARASIAEFVVGEHVIDGRVRFFQRLGDDDTLACREAVGLDDDGCALFVHVGVRGGSVREGLECGSRYAVPRHEALGEILGGFELGSGLGGAEYPQPARAENIDDAGSQRRFGADDG